MTYLLQLHVKNVSILLGCSQMENIAKFQEIAEKNLAPIYEVQTLKTRLPHIRIVGLSALP